jgi:hypothetical protein
MYVGPEWLSAWNGILFAATGLAALVFFVALLMKLVPVAFRYWSVAPKRA